MPNQDLRFDLFLKGSLVDLIVLTEELAEKSDWYNWFNDEENMQNMQKHYFPNTREEQLKFFRTDISGNRSKLQLGILHKESQNFIGVISLNQIDYLHGKAEIGGFIGDKRYQNFKNFLEANRLIIRHGFEQLNLRRIYGGTMIKELAEFYVRCLGFSHEGVLARDIYKNGRYNDVYLIGCLKDQQ